MTLRAIFDIPLHMIPYIKNSCGFGRNRRAVIANLCLMITLLLPAWLFPAAVCHAQGNMKFVLLRSGKIIEGKANRVGRETRIDLADGGYIVVPSEKIEKSFRARRDVFNYRIAITPISPRQQDDLLYWLCKEKAYGMAESQLNELAAHPNLLKGFDMRGWRETLKKKTTATPSVATTVQTQPLPQANFAKNVNNHLVLGCAISGCHNSDSNSSFSLTERLYSTEATQLENFKTTRSQIQSIGKQKFLSFVSRKHGPLKRGMYPTATREYLAIATWVNGLKVSQDTTQPLVQSTKQPKLKTIPSFSPKPIDRTRSKPIMDSKVIQTSADSEFVPRDEFDPEIFNRMQSEKWDVVQKPVKAKERVSAAPQRLISPDKTNSRK